MNLEIIKNELKNNLNKPVLVNVFSLRNKSYKLKGVLSKMYPNIFVIKTDNEEKTFSYSEVATGDVKITYL